MFDMMLAAAAQLAGVLLCAALVRGALRATLLVWLAACEALGAGGAA